MTLDQRQAALVALGGTLRDADYRFITPTPETHRRVNHRPDRRRAHNLRDVFGWSLPFRAELLPKDVLTLCQAAGVLKAGPESGDLISQVRFSTLSSATGEYIFVHSAYPTTGANAVFFGPDSYRFAALVSRAVWKGRRLVDVGCGTGVGGLILAPRVDQVVLADVSAAALELAAVNAALAGLAPPVVTLCESDVLAQVDGDIDVVVSNPPYLVGPVETESSQPGRIYRDGGGPLGIDLAARIATSALSRLAASGGGQLVLYTGVPIVEGRNVLQDRLEPDLLRTARTWTWEELDPDVFGEELERPAYRDAERIAVVALDASVASSR